MKKKIIIPIIVAWLVIGAAVGIIYAVTYTAKNTDGDIIKLEDSDDFVALAKSAANDGIAEDESISSVTLNGKELLIEATLSADKGTFEDMDDSEYYPMMASTRFGSITDEILALDSRYDSFWDRITVHFAGVGSVTCTQDYISENSVGRYFDTDKLPGNDYEFTED